MPPEGNTFKAVCVSAKDSEENHGGDNSGRGRGEEDGAGLRRNPFQSCSKVHRGTQRCHEFGAIQKVRVVLFRDTVALSFIEYI